MYLPVHDRSLQRTASPENDDSVRSLFFKKIPVLAYGIERLDGFICL